MADESSTSEGDSQADGDYPLAEPDSKRPGHDLADGPLLSAVASESVPEERFQFTLAELFVLTIGVSVFFSLVASMPGGFSTAYAAGYLGVGVLLSRVVLGLVPSSRAIVYVGWWVTFAMYLLLCVLAAIKS